MVTRFDSHDLILVILVKLSLIPKRVDVLENKGYVSLSVLRYGNLKGTTKAV